MINWTLKEIIGQFDDFLGDVDFAHLPERESEEYRQLVLKMANDVMFSEGRYSRITEWTLEMFDASEVCELTQNLSEINRLTEDERVRLGFYMDLKEMCYPLFRGQKIDWTAWPWNLSNPKPWPGNDEFYDLITKCEWPCLSAAILYGLEQQIFKDKEKIYTSVARQEASHVFWHYVDHNWTRTMNEEEQKKLTAGICKCADDMWSIGNHMLVGRELGFDWLTQSVYDSFDTFIDPAYRHNQILCARELTAWLKEHWPIGEPHPTQEQVDELYDKWKSIMAEYGVSTPDASYSWDILTLDGLGMSMFSKEEEEDDCWDEEE